MAGRKGFGDKSCDKSASGTRERRIVAGIVTANKPDGMRAIVPAFSAKALGASSKFKDVVTRESRGKSYAEKTYATMKWGR